MYKPLSGKNYMSLTLPHGHKIFNVCTERLNSLATFLSNFNLFFFFSRSPTRRFNRAVPVVREPRGSPVDWAASRQIGTAKKAQFKNGNVRSSLFTRALLRPRGSRYGTLCSRWDCVSGSGAREGGGGIIEETSHLRRPLTRSETHIEQNDRHTNNKPICESFAKQQCGWTDDAAFASPTDDGNNRSNNNTLMPCSSSLFNATWTDNCSRKNACSFGAVIDSETWKIIITMTSRFEYKVLLFSKLPVKWNLTGNSKKNIYISGALLQLLSSRSIFIKRDLSTEKKCLRWHTFEAVTHFARIENFLIKWLND